MNRPACHLCGATENVKLRRLIDAGGAVMVAWNCTDCNRWAEKPPKWIKHDAVKTMIGIRYTLDDIPIVEDYRQPCVICDTLGAQYHHFFPQMYKDHSEVAPDWCKWDSLGAMLCQYHHDLWHDLVTPAMPGRGNSRNGHSK